MIRAVLDTNVIISALVNRRGVPAEIVQHWKKRDFELVASNALLGEYQRVLSYPRIRNAYGFEQGEIDEMIYGFQIADIFVSLDVPEAVVAADPDDDVVVATAVAGNADFIVSGDRHLLELGEHHGIRILRPALFLLILQEAPE